MVLIIYRYRLLSHFHIFWIEKRLCSFEETAPHKANKILTYLPFQLIL